MWSIFFVNILYHSRIKIFNFILSFSSHNHVFPYLCEVPAESLFQQYSRLFYKNLYFGWWFQEEGLYCRVFFWIFQFFFFLGGFSFTNIHDSQDSKGKGRLFFLTLLYHFHPLHRHSDISRAITADSSLLHIASSRI